MDLCMSGITCQKVWKIYRQRSIMKRPGLVNEVSMFVGYGSFFHFITPVFSLTLSLSTFARVFKGEIIL